MQATGCRKRALLLVFDVPPNGRSGMPRTSKFARYLPELGWDVAEPTVRPSAYDTLNLSMLDQIPGQVSVHRTFCPHPAKHMSIGGALSEHIQFSTALFTGFSSAFGKAGGSSARGGLT
jgi:hypothetical protein